MAVKRYPKRFVAIYHYTDPDSGQEEDISFVANGRIMPLFKSMVGVELAKALEEYKESLCKVLNKNSVEAVFKFDEAKSSADKLAVLSDNIEDFSAMMRAALEVHSYGESDIDLIEAILICARICALPADDEGEALALGTEIIPDEIYQDPTFAFEILQLAINYEAHAKKNSKS